MKRRMASMLLAGALLASLTACGSAPTASGSGSGSNNDEQLHVRVILKTTASEHWQLMQAGCEKFDKEHDDVTFEITGPASETSYDDQQNMIETSLANDDIDAFIIAPLQSDVAANLISGETRPIFSMDTDIDAPEVLSFIGTGNENAAKKGAAMAVEAAKAAGWEKIECIEVAGVQGDSTNTARMKGFTAGIEENGGDFLEDEVQYANALPDQAVTCMEAIMQTHPEGVAIICANNDDMAVAAAKAAAEANLESYKNTIFLGFDGSSGACQSIIDGQLNMSIAQQPFDMGYLACEAAYNTLKGEKVDSFIDSQIEVISPDNAQDRIDRVHEWLGR